MLNATDDCQTLIGHHCLGLAALYARSVLVISELNPDLGNRNMC